MSAPRRTRTAARPNFILLMTDTQGANVLGRCGRGREPRTPHSPAVGG